MASFTNEEIKKLSKDILDQPNIVANWQLAYDNSFVKEAEILNLDNQNKKFFDDALAAISSYHNELLALKGEVRTLYSETSLIQSSENIDQDKPHFPNPPTYASYWTKVQPLVIASNNGNPRSTNYASLNDKNISEGINFYANAIANGFNYGSNKTTSSSNISNTGYSATHIPSFTSDINVGDYVWLRSSGGLNSLVKIRSVVTGVNNPPPASSSPDVIEWTYIIGSLPSALGGTVDLILNRSGFIEGERQGLIISLNPTILQLYKDLIDTYVDNYISFLNSLKTTIQSNNVGAPYKGQNETEIANIDQTISDLNIWKSYPSTVTIVTNPSRFDDIRLSLLDSILSVRQLADRATIVSNALGNVTQTSSGSYTGSGLYFQLFLWVDKRINVAEGSLSEYKGFPASQLYYSQQIDLAQNILNQYELAYVVIQLAQNYVYDSDNPSNILKLLNVNNLVVNDSIKVMDNDSSVFDRIITFVNTATNEIYLDSPITANLNAVGKQARVFKEK